MIWKISDLAPTSMPRVGSSRSSTLGAVRRPLATTTFCWLPPDSEPMLAPGLETRTERSSIIWSTGAALLARATGRSG